MIQFSSVLLSDLEQIMVIQDRTYPIDAAATSFQIIEAIRELNGAGASELANHLDMPKSTVHDYL